MSTMLQCPSWSETTFRSTPAARARLAAPWRRSCSRTGGSPDAFTSWVLRPTPGHTRSMLRLFTAPGEDPPETEVEWMTLMAATCRTTLAPPPLPAALLTRRASRPCIVGTGEHDRFLPPRRLAPALRQAMGLDLRILPGMGHLTTPDHLGDVVSLIAEAVGQAAG